MSYCVNCGVELNGSEKYCPLCDTEVINPAKPWEEPEERPYPRHVERLNKHISRKFLVLILTLIALLPVLICLSADIFANERINWSLYVVGAMVMLYVAVMLPLLPKPPRLPVLMMLDCLTAIGYIWMVETVSGGNWFLTLGLPISGSAAMLIMAITLLFYYKTDMGVFTRTACVLFAAGVFVLCIELTLKLHAGNIIKPGWSIYALLPCSILAGVFLILERKENFKKELKKRFFV